MTPLTCKRASPTCTTGSFKATETSVETINYLTKHGAICIGVTRRVDTNGIGEATIDMMEREFGDNIAATYFTNGQSKYNLLRHLNVSIMVDDMQDTIKECINSPIKGFLVSNEDTGHNYDFAKAAPLSIKVVDRLNGIIPHLEEMFK